METDGALVARLQDELDITKRELEELKEEED
jgi:hypothetical protein